MNCFLLLGGSSIAELRNRFVGDKFAEDVFATGVDDVQQTVRTAIQMR